MKKHSGIGRKIGIGCGGLFAAFILLGVIGSCLVDEEDLASTTTSTQTDTTTTAATTETTTSEVTTTAVETTTETTIPTTETTTSTPPAATTAGETTTSVPPAPAGPSDEEVEEWLKMQLGVERFTDALAIDPTLWTGYVAGAQFDGSKLHVQLQVDRSEKPMAKQAAAALANLIRFTPDGWPTQVKWVLIEDGAGNVMAQKQPR